MNKAWRLHKSFETYCRKKLDEFLEQSFVAYLERGVFLKGKIDSEPFPERAWRMFLTGSNQRNLESSLKISKDLRDSARNPPSLWKRLGEQWGLQIDHTAKARNVFYGEQSTTFQENLDSTQRIHKTFGENLKKTWKVYKYLLKFNFELSGKPPVSSTFFLNSQGYLPTSRSPRNLRACAQARTQSER